MRICFDLDGVVAELRDTGQSYDRVLPVPGAIERLRTLKAAGHTIIIHTARHMKTCEGNVGAVMARVGGLTLDWLVRHEVPYDEIYFGKPWADVYIDDNGLRFERWDQIDAEGTNLPRSIEHQRLSAGLDNPGKP